MKQHSHSHISVRFTFACPCKVRTCNRYAESFYKQHQSLEYFFFFSFVFASNREVKTQGERLAGFPTLLASVDSGGCTWRLLIHCSSRLTITLLQMGGRNGVLGTERVPAFGLSHLWTLAAKSRGKWAGYVCPFWIKPNPKLQPVLGSSVWHGREQISLLLKTPFFLLCLWIDRQSFVIFDILPFCNVSDCCTLHLFHTPNLEWQNSSSKRNIQRSIQLKFSNWIEGVICQPSVRRKTH